jgi:hypothetical protein
MADVIARQDELSVIEIHSRKQQKVDLFPEELPVKDIDSPEENESEYPDQIDDSDSLSDDNELDPNISHGSLKQSENMENRGTDLQTGPGKHPKSFGSTLNSNKGEENNIEPTVSCVCHSLVLESSTEQPVKKQIDLQGNFTKDPDINNTIQPELGKIHITLEANQDPLISTEKHIQPLPNVHEHLDKLRDTQIDNFHDQFRDDSTGESETHHTIATTTQELDQLLLSCIVSLEGKSNAERKSQRKISTTKGSKNQNSVLGPDEPSVSIQSITMGKVESRSLQSLVGNVDSTIVQQSLAPEQEKPPTPLRPRKPIPQLVSEEPAVLIQSTTTGKAESRSLQSLVDNGDSKIVQSVAPEQEKPPTPLRPRKPIPQLVSEEPALPIHPTTTGKAESRSLQSLVDNGDSTIVQSVAPEQEKPTTPLRPRKPIPQLVSEEPAVSIQSTTTAKAESRSLQSLVGNGDSKIVQSLAPEQEKPPTPLRPRKPIPHLVSEDTSGERSVKRTPHDVVGNSKSIIVQSLVVEHEKPKRVPSAPILEKKESRTNSAIDPSRPETRKGTANETNVSSSIQISEPKLNLTMNIVPSSLFESGEPSLQTAIKAPVLLKKSIAGNKTDYSSTNSTGLTSNKPVSKKSPVLDTLEIAKEGISESALKKKENNYIIQTSSGKISSSGLAYASTISSSQSIPKLSDKPTPEKSIQEISTIPKSVIPVKVLLKPATAEAPVLPKKKAKAMQ